MELEKGRNLFTDKKDPKEVEMWIKRPLEIEQEGKSYLYYVHDKQFTLIPGSHRLCSLNENSISHSFSVVPLPPPNQDDPDDHCQRAICGGPQHNEKKLQVI